MISKGSGFVEKLVVFHWLEVFSVIGKGWSTKILSVTRTLCVRKTFPLSDKKASGCFYLWDSGNSRNSLIEHVLIARPQTRQQGRRTWYEKMEQGQVCGTRASDWELSVLTEAILGYASEVELKLRFSLCMKYVGLYWVFCLASLVFCTKNQPKCCICQGPHQVGPTKWKCRGKEPQHISFPFPSSPLCCQTLMRDCQKWPCFLEGSKQLTSRKGPGRGLCMFWISFQT